MEPYLAARLASAATNFVAAPASARPLAVLRIGLSVVLLIQALAIAGQVQTLYGERGVAQWAVTDPTIPTGVPRVRWVAEVLAPFGLGADVAVRLTFLAYIAGLAYLALGWHTRVAAVIAWLGQVALNASGSATIYGVDQFAVIALFYCVWMPVGDALSVDRLLGRTSGAPSSAARVGLRLLQAHLCVVYLASGLDKASGSDWWNGEAMWRALASPDLSQFSFAWLPSVPWVALVGSWATLALEIGYAVLVWPRRTRTLWVLATIGMHVGIGLLMGLASFAMLMITLNVSAFLVSAEVPARNRVMRNRCEVGRLADCQLIQNLCRSR
jgi:hypothetical protein